MNEHITIDKLQRAELREIVKEASTRTGDSLMYTEGFVDGVTQALDILDYLIEGVNAV